MQSKNLIQIDFHDRTRISVLSKSDNEPENQAISEIGIACYYLNRVFVNLGKKGGGDALAEVLRSSDPQSSLNSYLYPKLPFTIIANSGSPTKRSFLSVAVWQGGSPTYSYTAEQFLFKPTGFGIFGRDVYDYSMTSALGLICFISGQREDDTTFQRALQRSMVDCATLFVYGKVGIASQGTSATKAIKSAAEVLGLLKG